jgi:hypothetical protein
LIASWIFKQVQLGLKPHRSVILNNVRLYEGDSVWVDILG